MPNAWPTRALAVVLLAAACLAGGCAASPWEENFRPAPGLHGGLPGPAGADAEVTIRAVEWERLQAFEAEARERSMGRDLPFDEWPEEWRDFERAEFLRMIRITEDPDLIEDLGTSEFVVPGTLDPYDGSLESFARRIGARYAVVGARGVGLRDVIVYAPLTTWYDDAPSVRRGRGGHGVRTYSGTGTATSYVPRVVKRDSTQYVVYFARSAGGD